MEDIIIMKDKIFGVLQRVGRSFMLPIALLPVAGLLLGIGSSFTNATTIETYHLGKFIYEGGVLYTIKREAPFSITLRFCLQWALLSEWQRRKKKSQPFRVLSPIS